MKYCNNIHGQIIVGSNRINNILSTIKKQKNKTKKNTVFVFTRNSSDIFNQQSLFTLQGFVIDRKSNKINLNIISPKIRVADDWFITNAMMKPMNTFCVEIIFFKIFS